MRQRRRKRLVRTVTSLDVLHGLEKRNSKPVSGT